MKTILCVIAYLALLFPTLFVALNKFVDIADPPMVTADIGHSFWLTGIGQCLWFGAVVILPAVVVFVFGFMHKEKRIHTMSPNAQAGCETLFKGRERCD